MLETPIVPKKYHKIKNYKKVRQFIIWQKYKKTDLFFLFLFFF